jgi:hypothetical protein
MRVRKIKQILKELDIDDRQYLQKVDILHQLLHNPYTGHIIDKEIVDWCKKVGLKPELSCEDVGAWWTCSAG